MIWDALIAALSIGLSITALPTLINKNSQVPRLSSGAIAACLSGMSVCFNMAGLPMTSATVCLETAVWWCIFVWRNVKKPIASTVAPNKASIDTAK